MCQIREVREAVARDAATLRTRTGRADTIAATDAILAAFALGAPNPIVLTSDPDDLRALVVGHETTVRVSPTSPTVRILKFLQRIASVGDVCD